MSTDSNEWENLSPMKIRRGQHLFVSRKCGLYHHHGIVISCDDLVYISQSFYANDIDLEPLMIIEQNIHGLQIVTISEFRGDATRPIHMARYSVSSELYHSSRRGTCYMDKCMDEDTVIWNAIDIFNDPDQHENWKTYRLIFRNCEQFAFLCCTNTRSLGEQIYFWGQESLRGVKNVGFTLLLNMLFKSFKKVAVDVLRASDGAIRDVISAKLISVNEVICNCVKGNAFAAAVSFGVEASVLTIRLIIWYFWKDDREKNLARKAAINPEEYVRRMTQAGFANLAAFGCAVGGIGLLALVGIPLSGGWTIALSILFGFLGYLAGRWISGKIHDKVKGYLKSGIFKKDVMNAGEYGKILNSHESPRRDISNIRLKTYGLVQRMRYTIQDVETLLCSYKNKELNRRETLDILTGDHESILVAANEITNEYDAVVQRFANEFRDKMEESCEELFTIELELANIIEQFDEILISARQAVIAD